MATQPTPQPLALLLAIFAGWTNRHQQRVIDYLLEENRVLRSQLRGRRPRLTDDERRRLARLGKALGRTLLMKVASIVTPDTILAWHRRMIAAKWTHPKKGPGRPPVMKEIRELIVRMAKDNSTWGLKRIQGALKELGHRVARSTVAKVLAEHGIPPAPDRATSWSTFLRAHWDTIAAADFLQVEVWTPRGLRTFFVLFAIRLATRRVEVLGVTDSAGEDFMRQVARNVTEPERGPVLDGATHLIIDNDTRFAEHFVGALRDDGLECVRIPPGAPDCNAFAERWVRSVKSECLSRMIFLGVASLRRAVAEYVAHYNAERSHQGIGNEIPAREGERREAGLVVRRDRLGGLLRYYHRAA